MSRPGNCQHHWVIETPHGAASRGVCRKCNEMRFFGNVLEDVVRDELKPKLETPELVAVAV